MAMLGRRIDNVVIGDLYEISREVTAIPAGLTMTDVRLLIKNAESDADVDAVIDLTVNPSGSVDGVIGDPGANGTGNFQIVLSVVLTSLLGPGKQYPYYLRVTTSDAVTRLYEGGLISGQSPTNVTNPDQGIASRARSVNTTSTRVNNIIDVYVDSILKDFRSLRVWDEHVRRSAAETQDLKLTYSFLNPAYMPEVVDGQNDPVDSNKVLVDFDSGTVRVTTDTGDDDYFVTYEFDLFPPQELYSMLMLTLQEVNLAGAENGGFITSYANVDQAPPYWDAPLTFGVLSKAFQRLATNSGLWKNYLIWVNDNNGPGLAKEAYAYYQGLFEKSSAGIKKLHYIAAPTQAFRMFESVGFGNVGINSSKFRELRVNRVSSF